MNICMIGTRGHNGYVFQGLRERPHVRVTAVSTGTAEDDAAAFVHGCRDRGFEARMFDDWREMLDKVAPDIVTVAGPFELHAEVCIEAFQRGIHVLCEKPVALTIDELAAMRTAYAGVGVHFSAMMGIRYEPAYFTARQAVQEGKIGEIRLISTRKSYRLGNRPAYYTKRATQGGTIPWVGSHSIDWIRWFTGAAFQTVYATHTTRANRDLGEMEMTAAYQFTLAGDIFAGGTMDYLRPANAPSHGDDRIRIAGTEGVIEVMDGGVTLINGEAEGVQTLAPACDRQLFADFIDHVEGKTTALLGPADTFVVTEACLLARQSADEHRIIAFPSGT